MTAPVAFDLEAFMQLAPIWRGRAHYFPTIGSTNLEARQRLHQPGGPQELLLTTDKQTAGRGRLNRVWEAPFATGLLCSLTLPLAPLPLERAYLYTAALALSVQKAAWHEAGQELTLKWPNDLLREERKCGGILAELEQVNNVVWLVLGFGLNTGLTERDLLEAGLTDKATNVTPLEAGPVSREGLLATTLKFFDHYREQLADDPESLRQEWAAALVTVGLPVQVIHGNGSAHLAGTAIGVDHSGGLLVEDGQGQRHLVQAGDVSVRLADGRYA